MELEPDVKTAASLSHAMLQQLTVSGFCSGGIFCAFLIKGNLEMEINMSRRARICALSCVRRDSTPLGFLRRVQKYSYTTQELGFAHRTLSGKSLKIA